MLGAGGIGEVYPAEHRLLKRPWAVKLNRTYNPAVLLPDCAPGSGFDTVRECRDPLEEKS